MKKLIALKAIAVLAILGIATPVIAQENDSAPTTQTSKKKHKKHS